MFMLALYQITKVVQLERMPLSAEGPIVDSQPLESKVGTNPRDPRRSGSRELVCLDVF